MPRLLSLLISIVCLSFPGFAWGAGARYGVQGQTAPPWNVKEWIHLPPGKKSLDRDAFTGKVVYLYCFQSWCPGCHRYGFPTLQKLIKHYEQDQEVAFIAVQTTFEGFAVNTAKAAWKCAQQYGLKIPVGHSGTDGKPSQLMRRYRNGGTPWTVIIDRKGTVRFNDFHIQPQRAIQLIEELKQEKPTSRRAPPRARGAAAGAKQPRDWLRDPKWDEGLAEVCLYEGKVMKGGILYPSTLEVITVREHFDPAKLVKTHPGKGKTVWPILKTNIIRRFRTGVYEYVLMASVFVRRDSGELVKFSCVSSEWCGNSSVLFERQGEKNTLTLSSYMDDRGVAVIANPAPKGVLFYEGLLSYLRQNLYTLKPGQKLRLVDSLLSNAPQYRRLDAVVEEALQGGGRTRIRLRIGKRTETFIFDENQLRTLREWRSSRGHYYRLRRRLFFDYWNRNRPGDEKLLSAPAKAE